MINNCSQYNENVPESQQEAAYLTLRFRVLTYMTAEPEAPFSALSSCRAAFLHVLLAKGYGLQ